ncbi:hypothetical protein RSOL_456320, partial [Rhizoctonia solani AG-3 Rhs1AP]
MSSWLSNNSKQLPQCRTQDKTNRESTMLRSPTSSSQQELYCRSFPGSHWTSSKSAALPYLLATFRTQGKHAQIVTNKRPHVAEPTSRHNYGDDHRPRKKPRKSLEERSSSPVSLPPKPTAAELRQETKVVASEEAHDKAGAKPAAPPKGKERKNGSATSRPKCNHVEVDEEESDDEAHKVIKGALKNIGKKAKCPAKSAARKEQSPPPNNLEQSSRKEARRPKPKDPPKDRIEEPEEEPEEPKSPPPRMFRRPVPKPPLPPRRTTNSLPSSLSSSLARNKGNELFIIFILHIEHELQGDGKDATSRQPHADEPEAGPSKEATWPTENDTGNFDKMGNGKPVGKMRIKRPVQQSDRVLHHNRN